MKVKTLFRKVRERFREPAIAGLYSVGASCAVAIAVLQMSRLSTDLVSTFSVGVPTKILLPIAGSMVGALLGYSARQQLVKYYEKYLSWKRRKIYTNSSRYNWSGRNTTGLQIRDSKPRVPWVTYLLLIGSIIFLTVSPVVMLTMVFVKETWIDVLRVMSLFVFSGGAGLFCYYKRNEYTLGTRITILLGSIATPQTVIGVMA